MNLMQALVAMGFIFLGIGGLLWFYTGLKIHESQRSQKVHMTHLYK